MNQCMHAAEQMAIPSASMKRRSSNDHTGNVLKRLATAERPEYSPHTSHQPGHQPLPPPASPHVSILPRPANGDYRDPRSPVKADVPKKRGRPSRADKAKRDLQPLLPRPPASQATHAPQAPARATSHSAQNGLAPLAPKRTAVPALLASPITAARPITPPEAYIPTSRSPGSPQGRTSTASPRGDRTRNLTQKDGNPDLPASDSPPKPVLAD